jgi:uncharacterized protein (DUF1330 family)
MDRINPMPKAYWIAHVTVTNPDQYQKYVEASRAAFVKFGAVMLARGGAFQQMEGEGHPRNVVIEFSSLQTAKDCYASPEYQHAKSLRKDAGIASVLLVEGV